MGFILNPYRFAVVGGDVVEITDDFSGSLTNWTVVSGSWAINGGRLEPGTTTTTHLIRHNTALSGTTNMYVEADGWGTSSDVPQLVLAYTDANNHYFARVNGTTAQLYKRSGGTTTLVASQGGASHITGGGRMRLEKEGSVIRFYTYDDLKIEYTDGSPLTGSYVGLRSFENDDGIGDNVGFDNFEAGTF